MVFVGFPEVNFAFSTTFQLSLIPSPTRARLRCQCLGILFFTSSGIPGHSDWQPFFLPLQQLLTKKASSNRTTISGWVLSNDWLQCLKGLENALYVVTTQVWPRGKYKRFSIMSRLHETRQKTFCLLLAKRLGILTWQFLCSPACE